MPRTVRIHRVLATTPEKVSGAFLEPHALEAVVGGARRLSFRNVTTAGWQDSLHMLERPVVPEIRG